MEKTTSKVYISIQISFYPYSLQSYQCKCVLYFTEPKKITVAKENVKKAEKKARILLIQ